MGHMERPRCDLLALPMSRLVFNRVPPSSLGSETSQPCTWSYHILLLRAGSSRSWKQFLSGCIPEHASKNILLIKKKITRKTRTNCNFDSGQLQIPGGVARWQINSSSEVLD